MKSELTKEQKKMPYAKYFNMFTEDYGIPNDLLQRIHPARPMDPAKALPITQMNRLLDPEYAADDEGYCVLPDQTGYVAEKLFYPGVTKEMFEWWFAWHGLEDTRYRIWDPKGHYGIKVSKKHLLQRTDPEKNWKERNCNTSDFVMAYTVDGISVVKIAFFNPVDFGFDAGLLKKYDASVICAVSGSPDEYAGSGPSIRVLHETAEGLHVWTYFWYGYMIVNKTPVRIEGFQCDPEVVKLQVVHCAEEYTRLGRILPLVYAENHDIIDKPENFTTMPF